MQPEHHQRGADQPYQEDGGCGADTGAGRFRRARQSESVPGEAGASAGGHCSRGGGRQHRFL